MTEALSNFDRLRSLRANVITNGMAAVQKYLDDPTTNPPVEQDPGYIAADREYTAASKGFNSNAPTTIDC